jgi:hypothetical protein
MKVSQRAGRVSRLMAAGLLVLVCRGGAVAWAQVLDQVPSDALVVVKINHLQDTSTKLASLLQALGITDFVPAMSDPLGALQTQSNISAGIDKAGDAAIVMTNGDWSDLGPSHDANGNETPSTHKPPLVVLIPVTDYKAFLTNIDITNTLDDISEGHFKNQDKSEDPSYTVNWGAFAAVSPDRDVLTKKPDGLKVAGLAARELTDKDLAVYANIPAIRGKVLPLLQNNREKILASVDNMARMMHGAGAQPAPNPAPDNAAPEAAGATPVLRAVVNRGIDLAQELLQDGQAETFGLAISKSGINGTMLAEFAEASYWGKTLHQMPQTDQPLLTGLPANKYMFVGGGNADPKVTGDVFDHIVDPFVKDVSTTDAADADTVKSAIANYRDMLTSTTHTSFGLVAPTGPIGQAGLLQFVAVYQGDAAKLKDSQEKQVQSQAALMKAMGQTTADQVKTVITPNAKTVDGVAFDQLLTTFNMPTDTPQGMQAQQFINILYGPSGMALLCGVVDPKTLLLVSGGNDQLVTDSVAAAKSSADVLTPTEPMKAVDAELPKSRAAAVYIPLDVIVSTAVTYARQFGFAMPIQIPPNLPPIGFTVGEEGSAVRIDGHVPTELIQSLVQAGMQVYLQMHGGGANGNGGGGL